jgi:hypothetical protein
MLRGILPEVVMNVRAGFALGLVVVALLACKKKEEESTASGTSAATTADAIGVPECDEYLTKYEKCLKDKVPEASRAQMETSMKQTRETYKKLAENPVTKAGLAQSCKQALETTKTAMASFNCTW